MAFHFIEKQEIPDRTQALPHGAVRNDGGESKGALPHGAVRNDGGESKGVLPHEAV